MDQQSQSVLIPIKIDRGIPPAPIYANSLHVQVSGSEITLVLGYATPPSEPPALGDVVHAEYAARIVIPFGLLRNLIDQSTNTLNALENLGLIPKPIIPPQDQVNEQ